MDCPDLCGDFAIAVEQCLPDCGVDQRFDEEVGQLSKRQPCRKVICQLLEVFVG